jgi:hypothetical protein
MASGDASAHNADMKDDVFESGADGIEARCLELMEELGE